MDWCLRKTPQLSSKTSGVKFIWTTESKVPRLEFAIYILAWYTTALVIAPITICEKSLKSLLLSQKNSSTEWWGQLPLLTHTVITNAAVRGTGRTEDLASVAVLQLHYLVIYLEILNARWGPLAWWHSSIGCLWRHKPIYNYCLYRGDNHWRVVIFYGKNWFSLPRHAGAEGEVFSHPKVQFVDRSMHSAKAQAPTYRSLAQ